MLYAKVCQGQCQRTSINLQETTQMAKKLRPRHVASNALPWQRSVWVWFSCLLAMKRPDESQAPVRNRPLFHANLDESFLFLLIVPILVPSTTLSQPWRLLRPFFRLSSRDKYAAQHGETRTFSTHRPMDSVNNGIVTTEAVENALSGTWPHFFAVGLGLDLTVAQTEQLKGMVMSHE